MAIDTTADSVPGAAESEVDGKLLRRVIVASSVGTLFEWYDFYLYGSLAIFFGNLFFPSEHPTAALLASLATFGAGFGVRPLGAVVFGYLGDLVGRKYTFLITMATMGFSTALVGFLPTYATAGFAAPVLLVTLRLAQGLALGGEYGGAVVYLAEHVPDSRRGYYTSFVQTTATIGFLISMIVIGATRIGLGEDAFRAYGWRIPFLLSFILLGVSLYIRLRMKESPVFRKIKEAGATSRNPLKESLTDPVTLKYVLVAMFGVTAGQGVIWYTAQFYALTFLQSALHISWQYAYVMISIALVLMTPLFVVFGHLSDRFGRKQLMLWALILGLVTYIPIYMGLKHFANPQGLPVADPAQFNWIMIEVLLCIQMAYACMIYGPMAAFLAELFPTRIRYTALSIPYHFGIGWFGGFLPLIATALTASTWASANFGSGAIYTGLLYPMGVCLVAIVVSVLFIHETKDRKIDSDISLH